MGGSGEEKGNYETGAHQSVYGKGVAQGLRFLYRQYEGERGPEVAGWKGEGGVERGGGEEGGGELGEDGMVALNEGSLWGRERGKKAVSSRV